MTVRPSLPSTSRRKALCVAAIVVAAFAVWSWLKPARTRASMATASKGAAFDPARRDATIVLARIPNEDPWAFAQKVAASSPEALAPTCGAEEMPDPANDDGTPGKPGGPGYRAVMQRIARAMRTSADPYDHAVADWLNVEDSLTPAGSRDALVARALTTSDPRVYALAYGACSLSAAWREGCKHPWITPDARANAASEERCASLASERDQCERLSARQWASLDPGNAVPWLHLLDQATDAGDVSGREEAFAHLAASTRADQRLFVPGAVVARMLPDDDDALAVKAALVGGAIMLSGGSGLALHSLMDACMDKAGGDVNRAQQCAAVSDVLYGHSDGLLGRAMGGALYRQATGDPSKLEAAHAEQRMFASQRLLAKAPSSCEDARVLMRTTLRNAEIGELEAALERAQASPTP